MQNSQCLPSNKKVSKQTGDFSGGPVVKTSLSMQGGAGLITGPGVRSHMAPGQKINT